MRILLCVPFAPTKHESERALMNEKLTGKLSVDTEENDFVKRMYLEDAKKIET